MPVGHVSKQLQTARLASLLHATVAERSLRWSVVGFADPDKPGKVVF